MDMGNGAEEWYSLRKEKQSKGRNREGVEAAMTAKRTCKQHTRGKQCSP